MLCLIRIRTVEYLILACLSRRDACSTFKDLPDQLRKSYYYELVSPGRLSMARTFFTCCLPAVREKTDDANR